MGGLGRRLMLGRPTSGLAVSLVGNVFAGHVFQSLQKKDTRRVLKTCPSCREDMSRHEDIKACFRGSEMSCKTCLEDMSFAIHRYS